MSSAATRIKKKKAAVTENESAKDTTSVADQTGTTALSGFFDKADVTTIVRETKNGIKYKLALKLVNKILTNIGKPEIDDLIEFIKIDRDDIISEETRKCFKEMMEELYEHYDKLHCAYYRQTDTIVLNALRGFMKEIGHELYYEKKDITEAINGKTYRRTHFYYSIR